MAEITTAETGTGLMQEDSGPQLITLTGSFSGRQNLPDLSPANWYKLVREMRRDPTIALVRQLILAPILAARWSVESDGDQYADAVELIDQNFIPMRSHMMKTAFWGCVDYGWQSYEKVFALAPDGNIVIRKLKPLLQEKTNILIDGEHGQFIGLENDEVTLSTAESFLAYFDVQGTDWRGSSYMEKALEAYTAWQTIDGAATRYDAKMAGAFWVVKFPVGISKLDGVDTDNGEIADKIIKKLQSSGTVTIPRNVSRFVETLKDEKVPDAWTIELIESKGRGSSGFIDRFKYLDTLKVRAFGVPERAILEGQFGTKAEATAHGDFAILNIQQRMIDLDEQFNWHIVNQLLRINFGPDFMNRVRLVSSPLVDEQKAFIRQLFDKLMSDPDTFMDISNTMDIPAITQTLGVPTVEMTELDELLEIARGESTADPLGEATAEVTPEDSGISSVAGTGLNGIQITSIQNIQTGVGDGTIPIAGAVALLKVSFPFFTPEQISALLDPFVKVGQ